MIRVIRPRDEPPALTTARAAGLARIRALGRPPTSKEIQGYGVVAKDLWLAQHLKCCYCERKVSCSYNDVDHYRPKTAADRLPGHADSHGYWWLAYTWENLLFACSICNRSSKGARFPLDPGGVLVPEEDPPGTERPLLLDPACRVNPVEHIQFVWAPMAAPGSVSVWGWHARPRSPATDLARHTIRVCNLNHKELLHLRSSHVDTCVSQRVRELQSALATGSPDDVDREFRQALELFEPRRPHAALSYDAMRHHIPATDLLRHKKCWPEPREIANP